jgi:N utilization substance protein B
LGCELHKQLIDDIISSSLGESWKLERLSKADYTILQVAICELKHIPHTPAKVVIKEYSSIADAYNSDVSFVNAVLDKAARLLRAEEMGAS